MYIDLKLPLVSRVALWCSVDLGEDNWTAKCPAFPQNEYSWNKNAGAKENFNNYQAITCRPDRKSNNASMCPSYRPEVEREGDHTCSGLYIQNANSHTLSALSSNSHCLVSTIKLSTQPLHIHSASANPLTDYSTWIN